ncbi:G-protein coupled receptor family C group 6 member A-like [Callorhinchus milii]|nr:G-protein coupled receptor family C group 6 member A-like [Callorhinchus milii]
MFPMHLILAVSCWVLCFNSARLCDTPDILIANSSGDIIIGGLFPIHRVGPDTNRTQPGPITCSDFNPNSFITANAMIYSIDQINNSTLLPGIKLGYEIYDTCSDVIAAVEATTRFLSTSENCVEVRCNYTDYRPNIKVVVGSTFSEVSIAVARILNRYLMPQVAYAASAKLLSNKNRFASFLRTVPSDIHQTQALAELVKKFNWNWIAVIATNDDYGRSAMNDFIVKSQNLNICFEFSELIPIYEGEAQNARIEEIAKKIKNSTSNVIVVFVRGQFVKLLFKKIKMLKVKKTWIASDAWSNSRNVADLDDTADVGKIMGIVFKNGDIRNFPDYMQTLNRSSTNIKFINNYYKTNCVASEDNLTDCIRISYAYRVNLAIRAIAHALQKKLSCDSENCSRDFNFAPWQLLNFLKNVSFTHENGKFEFDDSGDFTDGYDFISWQLVNGSVQFQPIGGYDLKTKKVIINDSYFNTVKIKSSCSGTCQPGERKNVSSTNSCCYGCIPCPAGRYSERNDSNDCDVCPGDWWSEKGSSTCKPRTFEFLRWNDVVSIVLITFTCLGILVICVIVVLFRKNWGTPAVNAAGGWLSYLMLFSILLSLVSIFFFIGKPDNFKCQIRQPFFGISFTCCISCILVKSFRIILAFTFNPILRKKLKYIYKPVPIITIITGIQVIICTTWLLTMHPYVDKNASNSGIIFLSCQEGSIVGFGFMLSYIYLLAFICFIFAFKGRKAPDNYKEAKFITFSVLIYLIVWILFILVYINEEEGHKNLPAIEVVAILASIFGILCCQFGPTSYIVCFKNESNVESNYLVQVREYLKRKGQFVVPNPKISSETSVTELPSSSVPCTSESVVYQNPSNKEQINVLINEQTRTFASSSLRKRRGSW